MLPRSDKIYTYCNNNKKFYSFVSVLALISSSKVLWIDSHDLLLNIVFHGLYYLNFIYIGIAAICAVISPNFDLEKHQLRRELYAIKSQR